MTGDGLIGLGVDLRDMLSEAFYPVRAEAAFSVVDEGYACWRVGAMRITIGARGPTRL